MRVHHLNCASLCPPFRRLVNGSGSVFARGCLVCHCLAIETDEGIVLVDTGLGLLDVNRPDTRLHRTSLAVIQPVLDPEETAVRQLERLGFKASDVRHIVPTHLDIDHIGGLSDFPDAVVHVFEPEFEAAMQPRTWLERRRYHPPQWAHGPRWAVYPVQGESWFGFPTVRSLKGLPEDILLVPLVGHTRGHCGVAVRTQNRWLLHCGDAYFHRDEIHRTIPSCPPGLALFEAAVQADGIARLANQARLRQLAQAHRPEVRLFSAHDPVELASLQVKN
ncbi:MAG: MBL fold metallo-hydrolase [Candidatus Sericytochromatia bacterium]|nr:MBL fold metallo-hydrolase [Candidatus Sericytochromatia bacterium]